MKKLFSLASFIAAFRSLMLSPAACARLRGHRPMRKYCLLALLGMLGFFLLVAPASHAQPQPPEIVPLHTIADPQDSSLALSVFFALKDRNGDPVLKDKVGFDQ